MKTKRKIEKRCRAASWRSSVRSQCFVYNETLVATFDCLEHILLLRVPYIASTLALFTGIVVAAGWARLLQVSFPVVLSGDIHSP